MLSRAATEVPVTKATILKSAENGEAKAEVGNQLETEQTLREIVKPIVEEGQ
mgnify:CR=1 FL=1